MLQIVRNRTWAFDLTIFDTYVKDGDPGNVPTNHTGWTIRSQIRTRVGNKLVANLNVTFPVPASGTVAIRHERDFTRSLATGDYWFDIVATDPAGDDHVYVEPEPIAVRDNPTDPANSTYDFVPGGGGAVMHTHVISDVTGLQAALNGKAPLVHTHSIANVTGLQAVLDGKAPLAHTHVIADVLGLQTILNDLSEGGGGSTTYAGLTDAATVNLPTVNTPLASALSGKAATSHTHVSASITDATSAANPNTLVLRDGSGGANFAGTAIFNETQISTLFFEDYQASVGATFTYGGTSASDHRIALGAGTTGAALFGAATAAAARTTLGLSLPIAVASGGTGTTNGSITGTEALTFAAGGSNQSINLTPSGSGLINITGNSGNATIPVFRATNNYNGGAAPGFVNTFECLAPNLSVGNTAYIPLGVSATTNNRAAIAFYYAGSGSANNYISFGNFFGATGLVAIFPNGGVAIAASGTPTSPSAGCLSVSGTTASTTTTTGALIVSGGVGIAGNINAGGTLAVTGASTLTGGATFGGGTEKAATRIALGAGTTGAELFGAATVAAANTILANNIVEKNADFTLAQTDAGTYMRLTKTGSTQTITLPTSGISAGAEFQFYRITTEALAFSGGTVNGTANLASVPTNGAFALKHISSGTYDFI
jgi:hypothetical protein